MLSSRTKLALALPAALLAACSDRTPIGADVESAESLGFSHAFKANAPPAPDLGGSWNWSSVEALRIPRWFAPVLGIAPEGENTHARCESSGTMALVQTGATFEGTASQTSNACETTGGQTFQQQRAAFVVADGRITGKSLHFSFHTATVRPCPHHAVIAEAQGGVATVLSGGGRCIVPGHPQSESPIVIDPPPGGTSTTLRWEAWR